MKPERRISLLTSIGLGVYNLMWGSVHYGAVLLRPFSAHVRLQSRGRGFSKADWAKMRALGKAKKPVALFFCSSAGEYEQACPVMDLLANTHQPVVFFFSANGLKHFERVGRSEPAWLSPPDMSWIWKRIYQALRPEHTLVVRHGFWPGMVLTAHRHSTLTAIDVVFRERSGWLTLASKRRMFRWFDQVHLATQRDLELLADQHANYLISGNTKYDRALTRKQHSADQVTAYRNHLQKLTAAPQVLVVGSAYAQDVRMVLEALSLMPAQEQAPWHMLVVPHDVSEPAISHIEREIARMGVVHQRWNSAVALPDARVTLVAQVGMLFELYGCGAAAWIGGGLNAGIHNVVEPAVFGLPLASGPVVDTDREAFDLAGNDLLRTIEDPQELADWLTEIRNEPGGAPNALAAYLSAASGAFRRIVDALPDPS